MRGHCVCRGDGGEKDITQPLMHARPLDINTIQGDGAFCVIESAITKTTTQLHRHATITTKLTFEDDKPPALHLRCRHNAVKIRPAK